MNAREARQNVSGQRGGKDWQPLSPRAIKFHAHRKRLGRCRESNQQPASGLYRDAKGFITSGIYAGTQVDGFFAIGPVPEPSSTVLIPLSAAAFSAYRWRTRQKTT